MADKKSDLFATLKAKLGMGAAVSALAISGQTGADGEPVEITGEQLDATLQEAHDGGVTEGTTAGFAAATARFAAVMGSDAGKANPAGAIAMLVDEDLHALSAEKLIAKLPLFGAAPAGAKTGAETDAAKAIEKATPKADLKIGQAPGQTQGGGSAADVDADDANKMLDGILGKHNGMVMGGGGLPGAVMLGQVQPARAH